MVCDIHSVAIDAKGFPVNGGKWANGRSCSPHKDWPLDEGNPFGPTSYAVFSFLAGVRNYSAIKPISEPRGLPDDLKVPHGDDEDGWLGDHSFSWLSLAELEAFNYEALIEDRRTTGVTAGGGTSGAITAPEGQGQIMTWRVYLRAEFFHDLAELRRIGADRVAFGFDD